MILRIAKNSCIILAHADFVKVRLDGQDTTGTQTLLPATDDGDGDSDVGSSKHDPDQTTRNLILAFSIVGAVVVIAMVIAIFIHCRRSKRSKIGPIVGGGFGGFGAGASGGKYVQLGDNHPPAMGYAGPPPNDTSYSGGGSYPPPPAFAQATEPLYDPHGQGLTGGIQSGPMYDPYTPNNQPLQHSIARS